MIQAKIITVQQIKGKDEKLAYSHAYNKELSKNGSLYEVKHSDVVTVKTTSIEEAVNEYNKIV